MADKKENWGLMDDFLKSLIDKNKADGSAEKEPDYEKMANDVAKLIWPLYEAFIERGADDEAAISLTLGLVELFYGFNNR